MKTKIDFELLLEKGAIELGVVLDKEQINSFMTFKSLVLEWNEKMNLTTVSDGLDFLVKHYLDSLSVAKYLESGAKIVDVGTGAGFPGIPILLAQKNALMTFIDSLKKRLTFLEYAIEKLGRKECLLVHSRAEDAGRNNEYREKYDFAVSRAVAGLGLLSEYCLPLIKPGGAFIAMKGPKVAEELAAAMTVIEKLGGELSLVDEIILPFYDLMGEKISRTILVIKKIRQTPLKYPRKSQELSKVYKKSD